MSDSAATETSVSYTALMHQGFMGKVSAIKRRASSCAQLLDSQDSLSCRTQAHLFLLLLLLLPTRRLGIFLHPNFYAEDGQVWFAQAYSGGWLHSLTLPDAGYLNSLQRLLTLPAMVVPFHWAPLVMALQGLILQILPVSILLSRRCRNWSPLSVRCMFAALYVFFPNGSEIHVVLTNSQWHLALALALLAFAEPPTTFVGKLADAAFFLLAGFCGPFGLVLLPMLLLRWMLNRASIWQLTQAATLCVGSIAQVFELTHGPARYHAYLGATGERFIHIMGDEVFFASVFGGHHQFIRLPAVLTLLMLVISLALVVYCLRFGPVPLRYLTGFATALLAAGLHAPLVPGPKPLWEALIDDPICRYWFLPGLSFLWAVAWCTRLAHSPLIRKTAGMVLVLTCLGAIISWPYKSFGNKNFPAHAREFENSAPGTHVLIPIYPDKDSVLELVKK